MQTGQTNRRRRRISEQQESMLILLREKPYTAHWLAGCDYMYRVGISRRPLPAYMRWARKQYPELVLHDLKGDKFDDPRTAVKAAKRGLVRLEAWGLVRLYKAPHPDADTTRADFEDLAIRSAQRQGFKGIDLDIVMIKMRTWISGTTVVPRGNRKVPVVWAEITEAGREWLAENGT